MPARKEMPNLNQLKAAFTLDVVTGDLYHNEREGNSRFNTSHAGKKAGSLNTSNGYVYVCLNGRKIGAHRVVWAMYNRRIPPSHLEIDHINRDRKDNRPQNLRLVTNHENQRNTESRTDLPKGVCVHKSTGKYQASIRHHLGTFDSPEEAEVAYKKAEKILFGHLS